jgi:REP element-mobilizing transposase RayT
MPSLPARRSVRLRGHDYRQAGAYFVTVCTFRRECFLASVIEDQLRLSAVGQVVDAGWRAIPHFFPHVSLDLFVVMPNHLHGIFLLEEEPRAKHPPEADASPLHPSRPKGTAAGSVSAILQSFKATTARRVRSLPEMERIRLWQRGFFDHIIRDNAELNRVRRYVEENRLRWALDEENPQRAT